MADDIYKKTKIAIQRKRRFVQKERSQTWLFVCEGSQTEPNYIKSLIDFANNLSQKSPVKYQIEGVGRNTTSLVNCVEDFFDYINEFNSKKEGIPFEKTFVVFDKDSFKPSQFDNAINKAENKGYIVIWSNECFELWYILHFCFYVSDNGRKDYYKKLDSLLNIKYEKSDDIFSLINSPQKIKKALMYSKKLENDSCDCLSASKRVPCTKMHELIYQIQNRLSIDLTKG